MELFKLMFIVMLIDLVLDEWMKLIYGRLFLYFVNIIKII